MPKTIETLVYEFDELSDKAKERARQWYRDASASDTYFAESVINDAADIAELFGLNFKQRTFKTVGGWTGTEPAVYWSGFSSQGDGASFEGTYCGKQGGLAAVKAEAPTDTTLHDIVASLEAAQGELLGKVNAIITASGNYYHSHSMQFEFEIDEQDSEQEITDETIDGMKEAFRDYADWIYRNLEKEYEYQNADEQVDDNIRGNGYEFTVAGERR